jgi:hypothetical protein
MPECRLTRVKRAPFWCEAGLGPSGLLQCPNESVGLAVYSGRCLVRLRTLSFATLLLALGCTHAQLTGADLDRVQRPAYVGRLAEGAGPKAEGIPGVPDASVAQLTASMNAAIGKFEVSERLRSQLAVALKSEKPWSNAVPASQVASVLETFLVERVPAVPPDYSRLKPTGADAVVELVVEEFGLRPQGAKAQTFLRGSARMFLLADGSELWRTEFQRSGEVQGLPPLDGAALVSNAGPYGDQLRTLLDATAAALAQELTPPGRGGGRPTPTGTGELATPPDAATKTEQEVGKTRAPAPDLTAPAQLPTPTDRTKPKTQPPPDLTTPTEQPVTPKSP